MGNKDKLNHLLKTYSRVLEYKSSLAVGDFLLQYINKAHPLPDGLFDIPEKNFVLISKAPKVFLPKDRVDEDSPQLSTNVANVKVADAAAASELGSPLGLYDYQKDLQLDPNGAYTPTRVDEKKPLIPLAQNDASYVLSAFNIGLQKFPVSNPSRIWIFCDGQGRERTVYSSSLVRLGDKSKVVIDSFFIGCKHFSHDPAHAISIHSLFPARYFKSEASSLFTSCYTLYGSESDKTDSRKVKVRFEWNEESAILSPPPIQASAILSIDVNEDNYTGPASGLFQDLSVVERVVIGLMEEEVRWSIPSSAVRPPKLIEDLINNPTTQAATQKISQESTSKYNFNPRSSFDFTDEAWKIMKDCSSYQELLDSIKLIFEAIQSGQLKPMMNSGNKTSLAELIRRSFNSDVRREASAWLKDDKPLQLLAEIGLEKLKNDYLYIFMNTGLVHPIQLAYFLGNNEIDGVSEKLGKLKKLHHVLELNLLLDAVLIEQKAALVEALSTCLKYYEESDNLKAAFEMPISVLTVNKQVEKTDPTTWKCRLTSPSCKGDLMQGCIVLSQSSIFQVENQCLTGLPSGAALAPYYITTGLQTINYY